MKVRHSVLCFFNLNSSKWQQAITHAVLDAAIDNEAKKMRIIGYFLLLLFGIFGGF